MNPVPWLRRDGAAQKDGNLVISDRARPAAAEFVVEPLHALGQIAPAPRPDGGFREAEPLGNGRVTAALGGKQDNPRSGHQGMGHRTGAGDTSSASRSDGDTHRGAWSTAGHWLPPFPRRATRTATIYVNLFMGHNTRT